MPHSRLTKQLSPKTPIAKLGLDFAQGVPASELAEGVTTGHVGDAQVLLYKAGGEYSFVGAKCSHYNLPLEQGLAANGHISCPFHHACFSLRDGSVSKAPGLAPLPRWQVVKEGDRIRAGEQLGKLCRAHGGTPPASVTIVGGGAAAISAVAELQSRGFVGPIHLLVADDRPPYDRTKLSKACMAGKASPDGLALDTEFLPHPGNLQVHLSQEVVALDAKTKTLTCRGGKTHAYDRLIVATGATPRPLPVPGHAEPHVYTLRTAKDAEKLLAAIVPSSKVVIVGASFIGLEAAAALRSRDISVDVISPAPLPFAHVFGMELAQVLRSEHERQGVRLHAGKELKAIDAREVTLKGGAKLAADVVLLAIGVAPDVAWLKAAGAEVNNGVLVDEYMATTLPHVFAAGDMAAVRSKNGPERIEHWSVAEQMGRCAALNLLGGHEKYAAVPFFWTAQYGYNVRYVGHAQKADHTEVFGDIEAKKAVIAVYDNKTIRAVITLGRDDVSLRVEAAMAEGNVEALPAIVRS